MINYHGHTKRCTHAIGEDEEYVLNAIKANYDGIGFSDHIMLPYVRKENGVRGSYILKDDYLSSVRNLQKKYKNQIEIYLGFECEWSPLFKSYYEELLNTQKVDYLIFGNHYVEFENGEFLDFKGSEEEYLLKYKDYAIQALKSGLFKIMVHPDFFMIHVKSFSQTCKEIAYEICYTAKENNVALELNCGPANSNFKKLYLDGYHYPYPYYQFWKIVKEVGNTVVIGLDAHSPNCYLENNRKIIEEFAERLEIKITDHLDIKNKCF